ncbi:hypothetical protein [Enterococcus rivorum]|uniref:hypothetical protein n=1 Tax=Enterococcus rivorum TaxID=762845 RepID=UPI001470B393|nr:hypothetical protein [Enterococcus rivorum]
MIKFVLDNGLLYIVNERDYENAGFLEKGDKVSFNAKMVDNKVQGYVSDFKIEGFEIKK